MVHEFSKTFTLVSSYFVNGRLSTNLYFYLAMETLYFLQSLHSLEKLKKWYTFQSCVNERFWFLKKLQISQKLKMICCVSFNSVLPLLRNFSSRFAANLFYAQFLSLPLCVVIYVRSLTVNMISKIRNIIFQFLQCFKLQSFLYWKNKKHFSTCTYIKHTLFPEGLTKNIKSSTSSKDLSTAARNKKKGISSMLIDWLSFFQICNSL